MLVDLARSSSALDLRSSVLSLLYPCGSTVGLLLPSASLRLASLLQDTTHQLSTMSTTNTDHAGNATLSLTLHCQEKYDLPRCPSLDDGGSCFRQRDPILADHLPLLSMGRSVEELSSSFYCWMLDFPIRSCFFLRQDHLDRDHPTPLCPQCGDQCSSLDEFHRHTRLSCLRTTVSCLLTDFGCHQRVLTEHGKSGFHDPGFYA